MTQHSTPEQQKARNKVFDVIAATRDIASHVIEAMREVPRHYFVLEHHQTEAYHDKPLPIISGQTISQITTVAMQTNWLGVGEGDKVLEVGSGSGYQAAVLHQMGCHVYSIERVERLHQLAQDNMKRFDPNHNITFIHGDGYAGLPHEVPFDAIVVTCGAPEMPEQLKQQLAIGGRMVIPVGAPDQEMTIVTRIDDTTYEIENVGAFVFVPMLKGTSRY